MKRLNGQMAWRVDQILVQAERRQGACGHIIPGHPRLEVSPGSVSSMAELREAHDKAAPVREEAFTSTC